MKYLLLLALVSLSPNLAFADDDADIKALLTVNAGIVQGNIIGTKTPCKLNVLEPGQFTPVSNSFLLILGFGDASVTLTSYPNDGSIYEWVYDSKGTLISYDRPDKTVFTEYYFNVSTRKFQKAVRVNSNSQTCEF